MPNLPVNLNIDNNSVQTTSKNKSVMNPSWQARAATVQRRNEKELYLRPNPAL